MASLNAALHATPSPERALKISVNKVSHGFDLHGSLLPVLEEIDLDVAPGEFIALLGPSGCGKSTLLRLISGLDQPTQGEITADGKAITSPDPSRILVYTGTDDGKTVTTTLIPAGAVNPVASDTAVDESAVKAVPRTAPAKPVKKATKAAAK